MSVSGSSHVFRLPKAGNSEADYEDAFAIGEGCVAIADGATESSFARAWAEALVEGFTSAEYLAANSGDRMTASAQIDSSSAENGSVFPQKSDAGIAALQKRIAPLQQAWHDRITWDRLPWFAEDKARSGAFATLLIFRFSPIANSEEARKETTASGDGRWQAWAIGDSCLFQIREDALITAFPMERAEDFNSRPILLSSNPANNERVWETLVFRDGEYRSGDVFLFATDALAHWILAETETGEKPWRTLRGLQSHAEFAALVARLRQNHAMRNDDVTLVRIVVPEPLETSTDIAAAEEFTMQNGEELPDSEEVA